MSTTDPDRTGTRGTGGGPRASALVAGFDPATWSWVGEAEAVAGAPFDAVPELDGELVLDSGSRNAVATDNGNIVERRPCVVLRPGSTGDVQRMVRYARKHGIVVAPRGEGHTTHGQSLSPDLVIELRALRTVHDIGPSGADVDAGVLWQELIRAAWEKGLAPPQLTDYVNLSVGGTLSVGGVSGRYAQGAQVDRVRELEVVTGTGEVRICSAERDRELFEAVLAGLGQCGIITRARLDLVPAPTTVRRHSAYYHDNAALFADMRTLLNRGELDEVYVMWAVAEDGGPIARLETAAYHGTGAPPDSAHLMRGLRAAPAESADLPFLDHTHMVTSVIDSFPGYGRLAKPWFDVWLPEETVEEYVGEVMSGLAADDVGETGFVLLFPQRRSGLTRPLLRVPGDTEWVYLFDILTSAREPAADKGFVAGIMERNRRLYDQAVLAGGTRYPIGSLDFGPQDWRRQYGAHWAEFARAKRRFDPDDILTPGPGIF